MTKIGIDHIIAGEKLKLLLQEAFVAGYKVRAAGGELDYGKEGWIWAVMREKQMENEKC